MSLTRACKERNIINWREPTVITYSVDEILDKKEKQVGALNLKINLELQVYRYLFNTIALMDN